MKINILEYDNFSNFDFDRKYFLVLNLDLEKKKNSRLKASTKKRGLSILKIFSNQIS